MQFPSGTSCSVADSRDDGCRHDRSDTWDLANPSATCVCSGDPLQLRGESFDLLFNRLPLAPKDSDEVAHLRCQICFRVLEDVSHDVIAIRFDAKHRVEGTCFYELFPLRRGLKSMQLIPFTYRVAVPTCTTSFPKFSP